MTFSKSVVAVACCVVFAAPLCSAQSVNQTPKTLLFRGRPLPVCKSFLIWETGLLGRVNRPHGYMFNSTEWAAGTVDLGVMRNLSPVQAIGGLGHLSIDWGATRVAALIRYRRWLTEAPSGSGKSPLRVDVDAGIVVKTIDRGVSFQKGLNFSLGVGLNLEDFVALALRYETYRTAQFTYTDYSSPPYVERTMPARTNGTLYVGIKGGSYIGATASILGAGVYLALVALFRNMGD